MIKNNLGVPKAYKVCLEADNWEEQVEAPCQNYPPGISEYAQMQEFACQQQLLDIQQRGTRRGKGLRERLKGSKVKTSLLRSVLKIWICSMRSSAYHLAYFPH
jgi:hypothetical protein